jgi:opacity protein-like surface antigen
MRWLLCGIAFVGVGQASAADLGDSFLRGSQTIISAPGGMRWDGFYVGGQVGATAAGGDFSGASKSLIHDMLRTTTIENEAPVSNWPVLGKVDTTATNYGGFVGYNMQWDCAVVGIEANYNRTNFNLSSSAAIRRTFATSSGFNDVQVNADGSVQMTDYGTLRVRGGYALGNFLPYGTLGLAVARADVNRSATVTGRDPNDSTTVLYQFTSADNKTGDFAFGWAAGLGMDMALMQNVFVRAEYEYLQFGDFHGINMHLHSARLAAAFKF